MPKWDEYKAEAKGRGALALELFVVTTTPAAGPEAVKAALPAHLTYQQELERAGKLVLAGPLSDETGDEMQGAGMVVYRSASMDEARALAEARPDAQQRRAQLHPAQVDDQRGRSDTFGRPVNGLRGPVLTPGPAWRG